MTRRFYPKAYWSFIFVAAAVSVASLSAMALAFGPPAAAAQVGEKDKSENDKSEKGKAESSTKESEVNASAQPPGENTQSEQPKALLTVRVYVPQMQKRTDTFVLNPYTTAPPKVAIPITPLPENKDGLKYQIINSGYNQRLSMMKPYPQGGWRWHYAYDHALKKSGITEPHLIFQMYNFANDLVPYVMPEVKFINKIEAQRLVTYFALKQSNIDNHKDEEMEALRLGLEPIKLNLAPVKKGTTLETSLYVSPGDWWITGSHKVPGLIYFWQEPIKLKAGDNRTVDLTDGNAILIQGGW